MEYEKQAEDGTATRYYNVCSPACICPLAC